MWPPVLNKFTADDLPLGDGVVAARQLLFWGYRCEPRTVLAVRCAFSGLHVGRTL